MRAIRMRRSRDPSVAWWPDLGNWPARVVSSPLVPMPVRKRVLEGRGHSFGPLARIRPGTLVLGSNLTLGRDTFINSGCLIDAAGEVALADEVHVAHRTMILTADHLPGEPRRRAGKGTIKPVRIGAGTWIGAGVIILPGVAIGNGCVIAAGAVVAEDLPPHGLYGGVPAKLIRDLGGATRPRR